LILHWAIISKIASTEEGNVMRSVAGWMILALTSSLPAAAQEFRSTVTGRVIDAQQSVVPSVKVVCMNAETGVKYETVSGAYGAYTIPFLPPGKYALSASATGFKAYERKSIRLLDRRHSHRQ
jgi:Carboxypeptidase regulatory-like domain